jgi:hypothetical protein
MPLHLLSLFVKSDKANPIQAERSELANLVNIWKGRATL